MVSTHLWISTTPTEEHVRVFRERRDLEAFGLVLDLEGHLEKHEVSHLVVFDFSYIFE